jgi:glucan phosphoethanolaminetransferase (alkaline phosphatase superfamily)
MTEHVHFVIGNINIYRLGYPGWNHILCSAFAQDVQDVAIRAKPSLKIFVWLGLLFNFFHLILQWSRMFSKVFKWCVCVCVCVCVCLSWQDCNRLTIIKFAVLDEMGRSARSVRFEVFTEVKIWIVVFWVMTPRNLLGGYHCFGGTCHHHLPHCTLKMQAVSSS